ncbi:Uncharacterised protein [Bordetella pertussis]|nr:Uncharacterised protein [Bordetella pertussis]
MTRAAAEARFSGRTWLPSSTGLTSSAPMPRVTQGKKRSTP